MGPIDRFEKLTAWKKAHECVVRLYAQTRHYPPEEQFGITNQMRRAAASVPANIVEGFNKQGIRDKLRYYNIARASLEEARYFLLLSHDLGFADTSKLRADADEFARLLHGLSKSTQRRI
jgi:four helix bundle protein